MVGTCLANKIVIYKYAQMIPIESYLISLDFDSMLNCLTAKQEHYIVDKFRIKLELKGLAWGQNSSRGNLANPTLRPWTQRYRQTQRIRDTYNMELSKEKTQRYMYNVHYCTDIRH